MLIAMHIIITNSYNILIILWYFHYLLIITLLLIKNFSIFLKYSDSLKSPEINTFLFLFCWMKIVRLLSISFLQWYTILFCFWLYLVVLNYFNSLTRSIWDSVYYNNHQLFLIWFKLHGMPSFYWVFIRFTCY